MQYFASLISLASASRDAIMVTNRAARLSIDFDALHDRWTGEIPAVNAIAGARTQRTQAARTAAT
jgi:hypothetical protein